jgi:hypothetical protein
MAQINEHMAALRDTVLQAERSKLEALQATMLQAERNKTLSTEAMLRRALAIDRATFEEKFTVGKHLLQFIITSAKSFALQDDSFQWGGPTDLFNEAQFQSVCRFADFAVIRITGAHAHLITTGNTDMQPDDGVHLYSVHASMWAVKEILAEVDSFKRTTRDVVAKDFGFIAGAKQGNKDKYLQAIKDGWYVKNQGTTIRSIHQHFFLEKRGLALAVEELRGVYGSSLDIDIPNCPLVVSWSKAVPPSLWPLAMMVVSAPPVL